MIQMFSVTVLVAALLTGCQTTTRTLKVDPKAAVATRTALAAEYIRSGDLDAAKRNLDEALSTEPRSVEANNMMGVLLQQEGSASNMEKAEAYFKRAIALDPDYAQARNNYGVYLNGRKRYQEAIAQFKVAGATLGYDGRAGALENLGRTYVQVGDIANAEKTFKQALQANRDSLISRLELAEIFLQKNQLREASALYNDYLRAIGLQQQGARSLWLGIRIAKAERDTIRMQKFISQLRADYPASAEYQRYLQLQQTPEAVWK
ncbi:type IV pilus biogenesis/stability protein PilW [Alkanindiges sp. WGS2144]|uniref:type IV pilus biogenesis/stability protein PilW n=1 Tax=Alkanindiges sp. WGS2144 TaxID=3366808 RepID=UPI0037516029